MRHDVRSVVVAAAACVLLSACSGGPSEDDMQQAFVTHLRALAGEDAAFESFEATDCHETDGMHTCKVKANLRYIVRLGDREQEREQPMVGTFTFVQRDGAWRLVR